MLHRTTMRSFHPGCTCMCCLREQQANAWCTQFVRTAIGATRQNGAASSWIAEGARRGAHSAAAAATVAALATHITADIVATITTKQPTSACSACFVRAIRPPQ